MILSEPRGPSTAERDGLVCGEGCGILGIGGARKGAGATGKEYTRKSSGIIPVAAENTSVNPIGRRSFTACREALASAELSPGDIDYISAHGTATKHGDEVEAKAIAQVFGDTVPVSSLKGYIGHTLGASGALELIVSLAMHGRTG